MCYKNNNLTNGDKIRAMNDNELADWLDKQFNQDRKDWEGFGCYNCIYFGTHHADKSSDLYECNNCEFENGIIGWLKREVKDD